MDSESLSDFFGESDNFSSVVAAASSPDDIFSILEAFETASEYTTTAAATTTTTTNNNNNNNNIGTSVEESVPSIENGEIEEFEFQNSAYNCYSPFGGLIESENEADPALADERKSKKQKLNRTASASASQGEQKVSHITVERQRRKQMNEHLTVLRSLMPCFYVKRGDQASIIGGVVNYINELQQVLQSLEAKKQRKAYTEVLSPRIISSPRLSLSPLSPRKPPLSPRLSLPVSPRTPQSSSPYLNRLPAQQPPPSPCNSSTSSINNDTVNELVASSKSALAEVEVKFSGPNLLLKTVSHRIPGQTVKIISALEELALEILQVDINTVDETMLNFFTIKIGIECQLSAEELAQQIQQTFG